MAKPTNELTPMKRQYKDQLTARTEGGRLVRFSGDESLIGTYRNITITGSNTWSLTGSI